MSVSHFSNLARLAVSASLIAIVAPAHAQQTSVEDVPAANAGEPVIVVTAPSRRGEVIGDIPPETELDAADVASYGASSVEDLLDAIAPETNSARGRGDGGRPVILLNGQRISGFRELRDLPPEAIERVQIFPEELALRYGYRPDQRVVNFILKENFASITGEVEYGMPTQGGFSQAEIEATYTRIFSNGRLNLDAEYSPGSQLLESERGIIQPQDDSLGLVDVGDFRTLIGESHPLELTGSYNRQLSETTSATLSAEYSRNDTTSLLGLPGIRLDVPASSPFARSAVDEMIFRYLPAAGGALARDTATRNAEAGLAVNGVLGEWRWSLTGNYSRARTVTRTDRSDLSGLAARVAAGDPALDPFAPDLGDGRGFTRDLSRSLSQNADASATIAGSPIALPAGPVTLSATTGFEYRAIDSTAERSGIVSAADLSRERGFVRTNLDLPLTSERDDVLAAIGDLSINGNIGYSKLNDFGGLFEYGYGINWKPLDGLSVLASVIGEEAAPSVQQLGDAVIVTPNVSVFDLTRGENVFVNRITGGNPNLAAEQRRDFKFSVNYRFGENPEFRLLGEYVRNRSQNVSSAFPLLTPEIEAAFPDRVTRDTAGNLVSIDARPVNFAEVRSERLRYGASLSGQIGGGDEERGEGGYRGRRGGRRDGGGTRPDRPGGTAPSAPPAEGEQSRAQPAPGEGGAPSGEGGRGARGGDNPMSFLRRGGRGGDNGGGRWQLSVYHTYRLNETVLIRPGVPELDLLDGSVTGGASPVSRHSVELEGGVFMNGVGLRVSGEYTGTSRIDGGGPSGSTDLFFGDLATLNLRAFFNFDSKPGIVEDIPFLAGSRISLNVDNIFGGVRRVTDANGEVPLAYQPGLLDPRGRYIELSFRKRF